jgi:hypothetical protein
MRIRNRSLTHSSSQAPAAAIVVLTTSGPGFLQRVVRYKLKSSLVLIHVRFSSVSWLRSTELTPEATTSITDPAVRREDSDVTDFQCTPVNQSKPIKRHVKRVTRSMRVEGGDRFI